MPIPMMRAQINDLGSIRTPLRKKLMMMMIQPRNETISVPDDDSNTDRPTISNPNSSPAMLQQDGDRTGGVSRQDPMALASLISAIIDEKLKHTQPVPSSNPQQQSAPSPSATSTVSARVDSNNSTTAL